MAKSTFGSLAHLGFPEPVVDVRPTDEGGWLLRSPLKLQPYPPTLLHPLKENSINFPDRTALSELSEGGNRNEVQYGDFWRMVSAISPCLKTLCKGKPLMILSGNSIEHAVIRFAAMAAGIPAAPVSPGYSLAASSFEKLRHVYNICKPGAVFVKDTGPFTTALQSLEECPPVIAVFDDAGLADILFADLVSTEPRISGLDPDGIDADSPAQIIFTSGSTGMPKAVKHTHRNLTSSLTQTQLVMTSDGQDEESEGVGHQSIASWLPWHHVSGTNSLQLAVLKGYCHYLDHGKPIPGQEQPTIDILRQVPLSFYVNVPLGYEMLINAFEDDGGLAEKFFSTIRFLIFGGAGITAETFQRFDRLALDIKGERVPFISAYGSTETTGSITFTYFDADATGLIGLPVPGVEIKLSPCHGKFEVRVKGPNVTHGYLQGNEGLFDDEGYLKMGDLAEWVDECDFNKGLKFAGRVAEEFKLRSGTWVAASMLRSRLIGQMAPLVQEVVICGLNREFVGALVWLSEGGCQKLDSGFDASKPWQSKTVVDAIESTLKQHNLQHPGSSTCIKRIKLMSDPLSPESGELSDKGSVNTSLVLDTRADEVDSLYATRASGILRVE